MSLWMVKPKPLLLGSLMGFIKWTRLGPILLPGYRATPRLARHVTAARQGMADGSATRAASSVDDHPWEHPYLTAENIARFRRYSEQVWQIALEHQTRHSEPLRCAFVVNMAQSMYKWARLAKKHGVDAALFPFPLDETALSCPEWEDFDGEFPDVMDAKGFLMANPGIRPEVPCYRLPMEGTSLLEAYQEFTKGKREPLLRLMTGSPGVRHEVLLGYRGLYPYFTWAKALAAYDVLYAASVPLAAYASGRPYCALSVGGDLIYDCGRGDDYGEAMVLSFNAARFLFLTNPHPLGHCRRLGLSNAVYLPYPMDDGRYCPGEGRARAEWEARYGEGVYVLATSRLDEGVKGYGAELLRALVELARLRPQLRCIFLAWGGGVARFREELQRLGVDGQIILLDPVGKKRIIDYYRSCDIVLDQLVYGYYGATGLEAAAIGKPVVMKLRSEQYLPLYRGDIMPAVEAESPIHVGRALLRLVDDAELRTRRGAEMRAWLVRNHGEETTVPLMLAMLRMAADGVPLPKDLISPLWDPLSGAEKQYHRGCLRPDSPRG